MSLTPLLKLVPLYEEKRGNLRYLGVEAPVSFSNLKNYLVIHIKLDMPSEEMNMLNKRLRGVFGPDTIVFTTSYDLKFCGLDSMTPEEAGELRPEQAIIKNDSIKDKEYMGAIYNDGTDKSPINQ